MTVDVKTGYKSNHFRLMVNENQLHKPKDYYVGVKLIPIDENKEITLEDKFSNISEAIIYGYADGDYLLNNVPARNYGQAPAHAVLYHNLLNINDLLRLF